VLPAAPALLPAPIHRSVEESNLLNPSYSLLSLFAAGGERISWGVLSPV
jgi:hypothetical protein